MGKRTVLHLCGGWEDTLLWWGQNQRWHWLAFRWQTSHKGIEYISGPEHTKMYCISPEQYTGSHSACHYVGHFVSNNKDDRFLSFFFLVRLTLYLKTELPTLLGISFDCGNLAASWFLHYCTMTLSHVFPSQGLRFATDKYFGSKIVLDVPKWCGRKCLQCQSNKKWSPRLHFTWWISTGLDCE